MNINNMIEWLKKTEVPLTSISKKTNISRKTLYNWINGGVVRQRSYQKIYNAYKDEINLINVDIKLENKETYAMEAQYIIDLQKEKIERLEHDLLKHKSTPIQETVWNQLDFDFEAKVKLTFENFTMGRTILSISNIEIQSKILGYSVSELTNIYDINVHHKRSQKHPVDKILHTKTLKDVRHQIKSLPSLFESLKNMMGNHYIPQPLTYVCKNKSLINAIAYNKVNWKEKTVLSKIKFLLND